MATEVESTRLNRAVLIAAPAGRAGSAAIDAPKVETQFASFWRVFRRDQAAVLGAGILTVVILVALFGPFFAPYSPTEQNTNLRLAPPGTGGYLLGGDQLGRDVLTRMLFGARLSLLAGFVPLCLALLVGAFFGLTSGFYGGKVDMGISRGVDVALAFPSILLAIGIVSALGPGLQNAMIAIVLVAIPSFTRVIRGAAISVRDLEYVYASRSIGTPEWRILLKHILPNCLAPLVVYSTLELGRMIIFAAGLSFLGLGVQPPTAEWGAMLADGRGVLATAPWVATIPGLAIFVVGLGANLLGDGLRDTLDPHMRGVR